MLPPQMAPQMPPQQAPGGFASMASAPSAQVPGQGMPQGSPPAPQGAPPSQGQGGIPPQILQMLMQHIQQQMQQQAPQQLAAQGRNGDSMIAHLTPGEMMVPPQVQTPKVLATLDKAYKKSGVQPQQFTAGSPTSSVNPKTGVPEYNFMSAFLPTALGLAATAATGGLAAPTLLSAAAGGLGTAAGGLMTGQTPTQAALSGLGSAGGSYIGGNLASGASALGGTPGTELNAAQKAVMAAPHPGEALTAAQGMGVQGLSTPAASAAAGSAPAAMGPMAPNALQNWVSNNLGSSFGHMIPGAAGIGSSLGSTVGGYLGGQLGAPPVSNKPNLPPGFNTPMTPVGSLPSAQTQLGMTNSMQPIPSFTGYNPATNNPAAYNFYPQG